MQPPRELEIASITVIGTDSEATKSFIRQTSGLEIGQTVTIPIDPSFGEAIRSIFQLGNYDDVKITEQSQKWGYGRFAD